MDHIKLVPWSVDLERFYWTWFWLHISKCSINSPHGWTEWFLKGSNPKAESHIKPLHWPVIYSHVFFCVLHMCTQLFCYSLWSYLRPDAVAESVECRLPKQKIGSANPSWVKTMTDKSNACHCSNRIKEGLVSDWVVTQLMMLLAWVHSGAAL